MKRNIVIFAGIVLIVLVSIFYIGNYFRSKNDKDVLNGDSQHIQQEYQARETEKLIMSINGISDASVSITNPEGSSEKVVNVKLHSNNKVLKEQIDEVVKILTKNIDSLDTKNITITNQNLEPLFP